MHGCYNAIGVWFVEGVAGIRVHASETPPLTIRAGVDAGDITSAQVSVNSYTIRPFTHPLYTPCTSVIHVQYSIYTI